jgi:cytochrome c biogenesis DsbD-like protein
MPLSSRAGFTLRAMLLAAALPGILGAAPPGGVAPVKKIESLAERDGVKPGESLRIAVKVSLDRAFHVNSHVPSAEYLIPTSLEVISLEGLGAGAWEFPPGETKTFPFSEVPLSVYEGSFLIRGVLSVPRDAPASLKQVRAVLKYQACTTERCYPPKKEEFVIPVKIVPPESSTQSLHPELFGGVTP